MRQRQKNHEAMTTIFIINGVTLPQGTDLNEYLQSNNLKFVCGHISARTNNSRTHSITATKLN